MTFPYKLIDLTHALDSTIPTWNGGCGFNHDVHIDYSDCQAEALNEPRLENHESGPNDVPVGKLL